MALPATVAVGQVVAAGDHNSQIPYLFYVREEQAANTPAGGVSAATWTKRALNTVALNEITGASIASNVITLPAGVYNVVGSAPAFVVNQHKTRLRQTSGTPATLLVGTSEMNTAAAAVSTTSRLAGRITLSGSTTMEFQHWCNTARATNGLGVAANAGELEVYAEILFTKVG